MSELTFDAQSTLSQAVALSKADKQYYQKITVGGQDYAVMVLKGSTLTELGSSTETSKLEHLASYFFKAHQDNLGQPLDHSQISYIDSSGIHFKGASTQKNDEIHLNKETSKPFFKTIEDQKASIVSNYQTFSLAEPEDPAQNVPAEYAGHKENPTNKDVVDAINKHTFHLFNSIIELVSSRGNKEAIQKGIETIDQSDDPIKTKINRLKALLTQHMTAQTTWDAMEQILLNQTHKTQTPHSPSKRPTLIPMETDSPPLSSMSDKRRTTPTPSPAPLGTFLFDFSSDKGGNGLASFRKRLAGDSSDLSSTSSLLTASSHLSRSTDSIEDKSRPLQFLAVPLTSPPVQSSKDEGGQSSRSVPHSSRSVHSKVVHLDEHIATRATENLAAMKKRSPEPLEAVTEENLSQFKKDTLAFLEGDDSKEAQARALYQSSERGKQLRNIVDRHGSETQKVQEMIGYLGVPF